MRTILFGNPQKLNLLPFGAGVMSVLLAVSFCAPSLAATDNEDWSAPLRKCWVFENGEPSPFNVASDNEQIFVPTSKGAIYALDQRTGSITWSADLGGTLFTSIKVLGDDLYTSAVFGGLSGIVGFSTVRKINPKTGVPVWSHDEEFIQINSVLGTSQPGGLALAAPEGKIMRLDKDGKVLWEKPFETRLTTELKQLGPNLIVGTGNKTLLIINGVTGALESQINLKRVPESLEVSNDGRIFFGDGRGFVYSYNSGFSRSWKTSTGAGISDIDLFEGDPIVTSKDNFVYRISGDTGKKIWKRKLAGRAFGGVRIDDRHEVYLTSGSETAVILDLKNGNLINKIDFDRPFVSAPVRIRNGFAVPTEDAITAVSSGKCEK